MLLFGRASLETHGPSGETFPDVALAEGRRYEQRITASLSATVFNHVFPNLMRAIAKHASEPRPSESGWRAEAREAGLKLLYRRPGFPAAPRLGQCLLSWTWMEYSKKHKGARREFIDQGRHRYGARHRDGRWTAQACSLVYPVTLSAPPRSHHHQRNEYDSSEPFPMPQPNGNFHRVATVSRSRLNGSSRPILLKKSLSRIREEHSVVDQFICVRIILIGYAARTIISQISYTWRNSDFFNNIDPNATFRANRKLNPYKNSTVMRSRWPRT
jgi:hypothetical protein